MSDAREHLIGLRLSTAELSRLDVIAERYGLSRVNALRMLVKRAHDDHARRQRKPRRSDGRRSQAP